MKTLLVLSLLCSLLFCGAVSSEEAPTEKAAPKKSAAKKAPARKAAPKKAAPKKAAAPQKAAAPKKAPDAAKASAPAKKAAVPVPQTSAPAAAGARRNITVDFRGGKILCAEISSKRPSIRGFNEKNFPNLPVKQVYAAVTFIPDQGRSLNIFDYCLDHYGTFQCVAIKEGKGEFISSPDKVFPAKTSVRYTLLFILDAAVSGNDEELCSIKALCDEGPFSKQQILFRNLKDKNFTQPDRIPAAGLVPERI